MQCLRCQNEAAPDKALCAECFAAAGSRSQARAAQMSPCRDEQLAPTEPIVQEPSQEAEVAITPAPHGLRLLAFMADLSVILLFSEICSRLLSRLVGLDASKLQELRDGGSIAELQKLLQQETLVQIAASVVPALLYYVLTECSAHAATPAKLILGLRVNSLSEERVGVDTALKRFVLRTAPVWPLAILPALLGGCFGGLVLVLIAAVFIGSALVALVDPLWILFSSQRQALHDILAGTQVVQVKQNGCIGVTVAVALIIGMVLMRVVIALYL